MIRIVDHLKEKESVLQLNLARALRGVRRGEEVVIYHPPGHVHGRLRGLQGVHYVELRGVAEKGPERGPADEALLRRLTTLNSYRMPYGGECRGEIFIHWFYRDRREDRLSACEIFHLNMLRYFNVMDRVTAIHVRCAARVGRTAAMEEAISILSEGRASVDFNVVPQTNRWEHDTIKEAVEYSVATGQFVYYTHFKGVTRMGDTGLGMGIARRKYDALDVLYWAYLMYESLFMKGGFKKYSGPILRNSVNVSYTKNNYGCGWSIHRRMPDYHYAGSFQAFDGAALADRFNNLGLAEADRLKRVWVGDPYTVEMFLSLCTKAHEVAFSHLALNITSYNLYRTGMYGASLHAFKNLYADNSVCRIRSKYIVLTYLYGGHTLLREPLHVDADVEYVCVSDRPVDSRSRWKNIICPLEYLQDDRLRVAYVKFHPFEFADASKILVLDASYQITDSVLPLFENADRPIMLLPHLYRDNIRDELDEWVRLGRMTEGQAEWFRGIVPYLEGTLAEPLFELSASVWTDSAEARLLGVETYAILEYNGFPSNQMPCSILAERHFKGSVGSIAPADMAGLIKYRHNRWDPCSRQSGRVVVDLSRFAPRIPLRMFSPRVLFLGGADEILRRACSILKWEYAKVSPGQAEKLEDLINQADIVVGIGRPLYDAMACGRVCISWGGQGYGCGYITKDNWHDFARTNFTGRGFPKMDSVRHLLAELRKYNPADGADMRMMAEAELNMSKNAREYLRLAGLPPKV